MQPVTTATGYSSCSVHDQTENCFDNETITTSLLKFGPSGLLPFNPSNKI